MDNNTLAHGDESPALDNTYPWTLATGAWGDSLCAYGNICRHIKEQGVEKANVVYFGLDGNVNDFFKAQPNIHKVSWLKISLPRTINKYLRLAATDFKQWMEVTELDRQLPGLVPTHVSARYEVDHPTDCYRDFAVALPPEQGNWGEFLPDPYILFQPYSVQSCDYCHHWPHWEAALAWVLDNTAYKVVLAGELPPEGADAPPWFPLGADARVLNIVGQTKCMTDLLHVAGRAKLIVGTSNALSVWSILTGVPALIACNKVIEARSPYYHNWIRHAPNAVLGWDAGLEDFKDGFRSFDD